MYARKDLWNIFKLMFHHIPRSSKNTDRAVCKGIRIILKSGIELIFIRQNGQLRSLETSKSYIKNLERKLQ